MRNILTFAAVIVLSLNANAITLKFNGNLGNLDHERAVVWAMNANIPEGEVISSARLTINDLYDWERGDNALFIHLVNDPLTVQWSKRDYAPGIQDYFAGVGLHLTTWTDAQMGGNRTFDFVYDFSESDLSVLNAYVGDSRWPWQSDFGLAFDPDCYYHQTGITFEIETSAPQQGPGENVPDGGSSVALLGLGLLGTFGLTRKFSALFAR